MPETQLVNESPAKTVERAENQMDESERGGKESDGVNNQSPSKPGDEVLESDKALVANYDLNNFKLERILNNNTRNKSIALLGSFPDLSKNDSAIVILEKKAFRESDVSTKNESNGSLEETEKSTATVQTSYFGNDLKIQTDFINNIYGSYQCTPPAELSGKYIIPKTILPKYIQQLKTFFNSSC